MNLNDDQIILSNTSLHGLSLSPHTDFSNTELDDSDDDCLDSFDEIQHILQTFGKNNCSTSSIDYYDSRRYEIMYEIMNIERQFEELKAILYEESVLLIDRKLISIQNEEAPEYQNELKKLYDEMKLHLEIAAQRHQIELEALENSTKSELLSLEQTLENDKFLLHHHMYEDIQNQIQEFETLKIKAQLCTNILQEIFPTEEQRQTISLNKKRLDSLESTKQHVKKRRLNGTMKAIEKDNLAIFYQLSDINVIEDWALIQTSLEQSSTISDESDIDDDSNRSDNEDDANNLVLMSNVDYFQDEQDECDKNEA